MNAIYSLSMLSMLVLLLGCVAPGSAGAPIRDLAKGAFSGIQDPKQEVIKDKATWQRIWAQHAKAGEKIPEVDFTKQMVVLVTMGRKRTGGYAIEIVSVKPAGDRLRVSVQRTSPPPDAMTIQALTAPFHMVAVPKSDLKPEFAEVKAAQKKKEQKRE